MKEKIFFLKNFQKSRPLIFLWQIFISLTDKYLVICSRLEPYMVKLFFHIFGPNFNFFSCEFSGQTFFKFFLCQIFLHLKSTVCSIFGWIQKFFSPKNLGYSKDAFLQKKQEKMCLLKIPYFVVRKFMDAHKNGKYGSKVQKYNKRLNSRKKNY